MISSPDTIGLGHGGLALDDVQDQSRLALGRPALDVVFHLNAHRCFLSTLTPEQEISGSIHKLPGEHLRYSDGRILEKAHLVGLSFQSR